MVAEKARVTQISYAGLEFEGLMLPSGEYRIAVTQLEVLKLVPPNRSAKQLKALTGIAFPSHQKVKSELNSKAVNTLTLEQLNMLLIELTAKGNLIAKSFLYASRTEKLERVFAKAFNQKFDEEKAEVKFQEIIAALKQDNILECSNETVGDFACAFLLKKEYGYFEHILPEGFEFEPITEEQREAMLFEGLLFKVICSLGRVLLGESVKNRYCNNKCNHPMRKRVDANQKEIIKAFKKAGCSVFDTSSLGMGFPDIVVGYLGLNFLIEIKDGSKPPSKRKLTPSEEKFHTDWQGTVVIVESLLDVEMLIEEWNIEHR